MAALSKGGHSGFTFHWPVSIPDMEVEFTGTNASAKTRRVNQVSAGHLMNC